MVERELGKVRHLSFNPNFAMVYKYVLNEEANCFSDVEFIISSYYISLHLKNSNGNCGICPISLRESL